MDTLTLLLLAGLAYLVLVRRPAGAPTAAPTAPTSGGATVTPEATRIEIPGFGSYINVGGGQAVQISLDPGFWTGLFGGGAAQPADVAAVPAPADVGALPEPALPGDA